MAMDVSTLTVKVESKGIDSTTTSLGKLEERAGTTERAVTSLMEKMQKSSAYVLSVVESMNQLRAAMNGAIQVNAISGASAELKKMHEELAKIQSSLGKGVGKGITVNIKEIGDNSKEAVKGVESLNQSLSKGQNIFQATGKELYHIRNLLGGTMLAGTMIDAAKGAITLADAWSLAGARLKIFVNSVEMAAAQQERLFQVSQELKVPMQSLTTLFTRLVPAMAEYGYNTQSAMDVTKSMAAALKVSGATAAEASSVLLQFSQSMAAGRLNGAEFNAVAEGAPIVLRMLSDELGVSRGALKKMASEGLLPTSVLANVLKNNLEKLSDTAKEMPTTVGAAIDMLSDSFSRFVGKLNDGTGVTGLIAKTIKLLADNLEFLAKVVGTVVAGFIAYNVALGAYNLIVASSTALSAALAAEIGIVAAASGMAAGAAGMLGTALKFVMANPIILALSAAAAALVFFSDKLFETSDAAKVASEETEKALANNDFATAVKKQQDEATRLSKEYSLLSAELVRLQAEQKKAKESGWATKGQAEVIENLTKQVDSLKKSWDKATASVKQYQDQQKLEAIKLSTGDMDEYTNKMEKEISLGRKMTKGEEALWKAQKARADLSKTASAETVRAFDANVDSAKKAIEVEKRYKKVIEDTKPAKKEGESFTKKYDKEIEKINLFIAKQDEELNARTKLTEAQAMSVKISEFIENNNKKLAASEKTRLGLAQDAILTKGVEIELRKDEVKTLELLQDRYYKEQDTLLASKEAMRLTNQEMQRKMELLEMTKAGVQESAVGEQLYAIRLNESALAAINATKGIREQSLELAKLRAETAQTPEEQALAQKEISMLKEKIDALNAQAAALANLIPQQKKQLEGLTDLAKITMLDIGRSPGQILADGFGEAGKAISEMTTAYTKFGDEATKINKYVADKQAALMAKGMGKEDARIEAEKDVADKRVQIAVSTYADMAGAAKGFFTENSKGYQAMAKAEKVFRTIELALAIKNAVTKMALMGEELAVFLFGETTKVATETATTGTSIALSAARGTAKATEAVAGAFVGIGPTGFITGAAMIAIMAGLGFAVSGGGGGKTTLSAEDTQKAQGAGTVFGDSAAKSQSISKALETVKDNSSVALKYNEGMLDALKNIESNITNFANLIVRQNLPKQLRTSGDVTKKGQGRLLDSGGFVAKALFGFKKSVTDVGLEQTAQTMKDILTAGLNIAGYQDIETKTKKYGKTKKSYETVKTSLSEEVTNQFEMVVKAMGSSVIEAAKALKMDGSQFTDNLDSFVVDIGRISLKDMSAEDIQKTIDEVFSKLGDQMTEAVLPGFEDFQKIGEGYYETLIRVASTVATVDGIFAEVGTTFGTTGMEAVKAKMDLVELAGGIQELSSMVGNFFDKFYTEAEKKAVAVTNITTKMTDLGVQGFDPLAENARVVFRSMVENAKETNPKLMVELLKLSDAVDKVAPALKEATDSADIAEKALTMENRVLELTLSKTEYVKQAREKEIATMDKSLIDLQRRIWALEDEKAALEGLKTAASTALSVLDKSVAKQKTNLKKELDIKVGHINDLKAAENDRYEAERKILENAASASSTYYSKLQEDLSTQVGSVKEYRDNIKSLFDDISAAIDKLTQSGVGLQSQTYATAKAQLDSAIALASASGSLPDGEKFKGVLEALTSLDESSFSSLFDFQREQLVTAGKLSTLKGVTGGKLSAADAAVLAAENHLAVAKASAESASAYYARKLGMLEENHTDTIGKLDEEIKLLNKQYEEDVFYLDGILQNARDQLDIANGTYIATMDVATAVAGFGTALGAYVAAKDAEQARLVEQVNSMSKKTTGLDTTTTKQAADMAMLTTEVAGLREDLAAQNKAIASNTLTTAKVLSQWDGDGQPEVRNVA